MPIVATTTMVLVVLVPALGLVAIAAESHPWNYDGVILVSVRFEALSVAAVAPLPPSPHSDGPNKDLGHPRGSRVAT